MLIIVAAIAVISAPITHPVGRRYYVVALKGCGRLVVRYGQTVARIRYPSAFVDWEAVRYAQWLESHAPEGVRDDR